MNKMQRKAMLRRIDSEVNVRLRLMEKQDILSDDYLSNWEEIKNLERMRDEVTTSKHKFTLDKEWIPIIGSWGGLLLIMNYERANILTGKAISFVKKA